MPGLPGRVTRRALSTHSVEAMSIEGGRNQWEPAHCIGDQRRGHDPSTVVTTIVWHPALRGRRARTNGAGAALARLGG